MKKLVENLAIILTLHFFTISCFSEQKTAGAQPNLELRDKGDVEEPASEEPAPAAPTRTKNTATNPKTLKDAKTWAARAKVNPKWQVTFFTEFVAGGYQEGFALFSESGYVDKGQTMIYAPVGGAEINVQIVPEGKKTIEQKFKITTSKWRSLRAKLVKGDLLTDFSPKAFDGIQFEYIHIERSKTSAPPRIKRVFMNNPGVVKPAPQHEEVVYGFLDLKR